MGKPSEKYGGFLVNESSGWWLMNIIYRICFLMVRQIVIFLSILIVYCGGFYGQQMGKNRKISSDHNWLVVWNHGFFYDFPFSWEFHNPN